MATITQSEVRIYTDSACTQQLGNSIITQSAATAINVDSTTLGTSLSAGSQYYAKARATNSEEYVSDWTTAFAFKTLVYPDIITVTVSQNSITPQVELTYDSDVLSITEVGVLVSKNANGSNSVKYLASDEQDAAQGWTITGLDENTTYYVVGYVKDSDDREYNIPWESAESVTTGYSLPTVSVTNTSSTYNSISGTVNVTSTSAISQVKVRINPAGGSIQYKTLTATATQNFTITNGDLDDNNTPININPSTAYTVIVNAVNSGGTGASSSVTITTQAQAHSTITITSISDITPFSARVNLTFGDDLES